MKMTTEEAFVKVLKRYGIAHALGITNFVTAVKTASRSYSPWLLATPQAANKTIGQSGFQKIEQMDAFEDMVAY